MEFFENKKLPNCNIEQSFGAIKSKNYECPNCGQDHDDSEEYKIDGVTYPKCFNESKGSTIDGNYWDWDELHCCEKCKTLFWFQNGAY